MGLLPRLPGIALSLLDGLADLLYPRICLSCGCDADSSDPLVCARCWSLVKKMGAGICLRCGAPSAAPVERCGSCAGRRLHFSFARGAAAYEGPVRELIARLKFDRVSAAAVPLGKLVASEIESWAVHDRPEILVPVPSSPSAFMRRGYNQADLIAGEAGRIAAIKCAPALARRRGVRSQVGLGREERLRNPENTMSVRRPDLVRGLKVCVVDDVMTTAATVSECSRALVDAGAACVCAVAAARQ